MASTTQVVPAGEILLFLGFVTIQEAAEPPALLKIAINKAAKSYTLEEFKPAFLLPEQPSLGPCCTCRYGF